MKIGVIGIDHQCNAAIREKLSFSESSKMAFATDILGDIVDEVVILSTCNRSEVYFARYEDDDNIFKDLRRSYLKFFACPQYDGYLFQMEDRAALEHLFSVASGLSSAIVGEDEILHQTKSAYEFSRQLKYCGKLLNKIFQEALSCAKTIKNSLKISEIPLSSGYIGLKFLQERCGGFAGKDLLLIGLGEIGSLFYTYARQMPFDNIYLANRNGEISRSLAGESKKTKAIPYEDFPRFLNRVDIVVVSTASPHIIIKAKQVSCRQKPIYILDMSLPRNVDTTIGQMDDCYLYDIDVFRHIAENNEQERLLLSRKAGVLIEQNLNQLGNWLETLGAQDIIRGLNESLEGIMDQHLAYLFQKIQPTEREKKIISRTFESAMKRLLRDPIIGLKTIEEEEKRELYSRVLEELFNLNIRDAG